VCVLCAETMFAGGLLQIMTAVDYFSILRISAAHAQWPCDVLLPTENRLRDVSSNMAEYNARRHKTRNMAGMKFVTLARYMHCRRAVSASG